MMPYLWVVAYLVWAVGMSCFVATNNKWAGFATWVAYRSLNNRPDLAEWSRRRTSLCIAYDVVFMVTIPMLLMTVVRIIWFT